MRKPIIAGNWKMYKTRQEALEFIYHVATKVPSVDVVDSVICAPFTSLRCLVKRQGENVRIGAQNMHWVSEGAYTGEISADMLTSLKVEYVVLGHSERRAMFNETDETVNKKVLVALEKGKLVGFISLERNGYINRLYTHKDFLHRGIASALFKKAESWAMENGICELSLDSSKTAEGFYLKMGFKKSGISTLSRGGVVLRNTVMKKVIKNGEVK